MPHGWTHLCVPHIDSHNALAGSSQGRAPAGADAPREWTRLWPANDGRALLANGGPPGAPVLWLWEACADASQARALQLAWQLHVLSAEAGAGSGCLCERHSPRDLEACRSKDTAEPDLAAARCSPAVNAHLQFLHTTPPGSACHEYSVLHAIACPAETPGNMCMAHSEHPAACRDPVGGACRRRHKSWARSRHLWLLPVAACAQALSAGRRACKRRCTRCLRSALAAAAA